MRKIKLVDGTIIEITEKSLINGVLKISTKEKTVEELAELFSNKENTILSDLTTQNYAWQSLRDTYQNHPTESPPR